MGFPMCWGGRGSTLGDPPPPGGSQNPAATVVLAATKGSGRCVTRPTRSEVHTLVRLRMTDGRGIRAVRL